uniref:NADH dehydrogenase subunit 6 n=1 Tax=Onchocerca volvulus TaxID=6282 RepID=A0A8R1TNC7_ONCVO
MFIFFYVSVFFAFVFFCLSFLDWDPLKSCVMMCLGVMSMSCYVSLGVHVWYSYFVVLIFFSGIFSLLTYFCSMSNFIFYYNYFFFFSLFLVSFFFVFVVDFDFSLFFSDFNFLYVCYDFSYYYVFWVVFILFLFLILISFSLNGFGYMRSL